MLGRYGRDAGCGWLVRAPSKLDASPYCGGFAIVMRPTRNLPWSGFVRVAE
jgi:hypothetical protein